MRKELTILIPESGTVTFVLMGYFVFVNDFHVSILESSCGCRHVAK